MVVVDIVDVVGGIGGVVDGDSCWDADSCLWVWD